MRRFAFFALIAFSLAATACDDSSSEDAPSPAADAGTSAPDQSPDMPGQAMTDDCLTVASGDFRTLEDGNGKASVTVDDPDACNRRYTLASTANLRDGQPNNPRTIVEQLGAPTTRTGNDLFDALHAVALQEARECSVNAIQDGAFDNGMPVECPEGGCFETGRLWKYVWTRDTAYAVDLGLAGFDPIRSRNSLAFKLSERREGGDLQIVQDTGTGGSYPVSTDRVSWAVGAEALLPFLEGDARTAFETEALEALTHTLRHDRRLAFDPKDGLYRGEQSFLDWREQSYPEWVADDPVHIAMSKTLSTNVLHYRALKLAAKLAASAGDSERSEEFAAWGDDLASAIRERFWLEDEGLFSTMLTTGLDQSATRRYDALGSALVILSGIATEEERAHVLANYPHYGAGVPVHWPQQQLTPIYHNRGEWPFVSSYWLRAAVAGDNDAVATRMVNALVRGAALNLSNMENFEASSGAAWVDDGDASGPVVNSQRQLWSVAGYLGMVHHVLFGLSASDEGLRIAPYLTVATRNALFADTDRLILNNQRFRDRRFSVVVHIPDAVEGGSFTIDDVRLDGESVDGVVPWDRVTDGALFEVYLGAPGDTSTLTLRNDADWREVFQPRTPRISAVTEQDGRVRLELDRNAESEEVTFTILRDGARVAEGLPDATTSWIDDTSDVTGDASPCYSVEACFVSSGNCSQHAPPMCWWGRGYDHIRTFSADTFSNVGGTGVTNHGRFHYEAWGDDGHSLTLEGITPSSTGRHYLQVVYGNGAGAISTGITCAVKRIRVEADQTPVAEGALIMPHLGTWERWADSNLIPVELDASTTYTITIDTHPDYFNMSYFDHFSSYTGGAGGVEGAFNRVNIAEVKILSAPE